MAKTLEQEKKAVKKIMKDLCYPEEYIKKINSCKSSTEINRVLCDARNNRS